MEPVELTATAIVTLIVTKAFEKTGETLGEKVLEKAGKLMTLLKEKFPKVDAAIMRAEQQPLDAGEAQLDTVVAGEIEAAAEKDPEVAKAVNELAEEAKADPNPKLIQTIQSMENKVNSQSPTVQNFTKLAEEIKAVFQGNTIQKPTFNF
ncbi:MAG: hypothetical protein F6K53_44160 [Moorea sp. SIO4A1]|uniref:hypothetical protein n=1 Tax=Moorena sp. SIO4A1 TaxID=2607835 RepID=UPI00144FFA83|nr:hypothetical protein [Moorena sp. SIO4A1]NEQ63913.1 hypothetical protein [Moorena sp. SIO4A1]